jgi:hypothetical protein
MLEVKCIDDSIMGITNRGIDGGGCQIGVARFSMVLYNMTMEKTKTPVILDPRQSLAISHYIDPTSATFGDLTNSLIKAGFGTTYARTIHTNKPMWITQSMQNDIKLVEKSEGNLQKYTSMDTNTNDPSKSDIDKMKIQLDASKFILKTLARAKYVDDVDKQDTNVQVNIVNYNDKPPIVDVKSE